MVSTETSAHDIEAKNADGKTIYYVWKNNKTELSVSFRGRNYSDYSSEYEGMVSIPESVIHNGKSIPVTQIEAYAFHGCSNLTSVMIPNSVTSIGSDAFYGTAWYENQPDGVVYVGHLLYTYKGNMPQGTTIIIEDGTIGITADAFKNKRNLTSIIFPSSLVSIERDAFSGCAVNNVYVPDLATWCNIEFENSYSNPLSSYGSHLFLNGKEADFNNLLISDDITKIGNYAFFGVSSLYSVTIPGNVETIGVSSFERCTRLNSITLSDGIKHIGSHAFSYCNFSSIDIPTSVISIGESAFYSYSGLWPKKFTVVISDLKSWCNIEFSSEKANPLYNAEHLLLNGEIVKDDVAIPEGVNSIKDFAFYNSEITSTTLPTSLTYIGEGAFGGKCKLTKIVSLINNPFPLVDKAFTDKTIRLYVPHGTLPLYKEKWGFKNVYEGDGSRPDDAIVFVDPVVENICSINWDLNQDGFLSKTEAASVTELGNVFASKSSQITSFEELKYFTNLKSISQGAFSGCTELKSLIIPEGVLSIEANAFYFCKKLSSITIPNSVTAIGDNSFAYCSGLSEVVIPNKVTTIGSSAFEGCACLTSVTIPASVTYIGKRAFYYYIDKYITDPSNPAYDGPWRSAIHVCISDLKAWCNISLGELAFYSNCATYDLYLGSELISDLVIPDEVKIIKDRAFNYCNSIKTVTMPNGLTSIGMAAFMGCKNLISIDLPNSVTSWGSAAFANSGLETVSLANGLTSIGVGTFMDCQNLISIDLPNSVTSIGSSTFAKSGLKTISIPHGLTRIDSEAFMGCKNLTSIDLPNSVTYIGNSAFANSGLKVARLGKQISKISDAFSKCEDLEYLIFASETLPIGVNDVINENCYYIMPHQAYEKGIPEKIKNFATYRNTPMCVNVKAIRAISADIELTPVDMLFGKGETESYMITQYGLTPGKYINWSLKDLDDSGIVSVKTNELILETQEPKALSTTKARLLATLEELDDLKHFGFEWRRIDAPDLIASSKVYAPLYNGTITGTLNNLKDDVYYKYRPFYQSDGGEMFYGEWMGLFTGDANVFFEPEVYTKDASDITKVSALLAGVWVEGTDDFQEKGFEYWTVSGSKTRAVGADVKTVVVTGNKMTAILDGLQAGKEYGFRSYAKTASGTTYGEEKAFRTILVGDVNCDGELDKNDLNDLADYIMGKTPTSFDKNAADLNGDDKVNAADIVRLVDLLGN